MRAGRHVGRIRHAQVSRGVVEVGAGVRGDRRVGHVLGAIARVRRLRVIRLSRVHARLRAGRPRQIPFSIPFSVSISVAIALSGVYELFTLFGDSLRWWAKLLLVMLIALKVCTAPSSGLTRLTLIQVPTFFAFSAALRQRGGELTIGVGSVNINGPTRACQVSSFHLHV